MKKHINMKFAKQNNNYKFLLNKRYDFIKNNLGENSLSLEIGAGKSYLDDFEDVKIVKSDIQINKNINIVLDSHQIPFKDKVFDNVICINSIHHFSDPVKAFSEIIRVLKSKGKIVIIEPNSSPILKLILKILKHEDYDPDYNYFTSKIECKKNPNYGNNAMAGILFKEGGEFFKIFNNIKIISRNYTEFLIFLNSSGVGINAPYIPFPIFILKFINKIDKILIKISKKFALCQEIIIIKEYD